MSNPITDLALRHPKQTFVAILLLVAGLGSQLPRIAIDTDPENMLPADHPERLFHEEVKARFRLYDVIVVGAVYDAHPDGVFNPDSLARLERLSQGIQRVEGVIRDELISPSTVDNVFSDGIGTLRFEWLLGPTLPATEEAARAVRDAARRLPTLDGLLLSDDGQAVAMYVPIAQKDESYRIATEIERIIDELGGPEDYFITGLPAAEDTFGVQMFQQMAVSAPLAGLVIFLVMAWFFRSLVVIAAPMLVAMATVIATMGLLIGMGFEVHIMSSMIPIFLMPIAVVDSVHVLSEFADRYRPGHERIEVLREVMAHLFLPMLFTSLTSAAGFASLALTPIPPVRVFGLFVAFGILLAFVLTIAFVPAYIAVIGQKRLDRMAQGRTGSSGSGGLLSRSLRWVGSRLGGQGKPVLALLLLLVTMGVIGITRIQINDNPVRWFQSSHPIRVADQQLNAHFAGTYPAFLVLTASQTDEAPLIAHIGDALTARGLDASQDPLADVLSQVDALARRLAEGPANPPLTTLVEAVADSADAAPEADYDAWLAVLDTLEGIQSRSQVFQTPEALAYLEGLQAHIEAQPAVGNTLSVADIVKTVHRDLQNGSEAFYAIPASQRAVAQTLLSFQSSHRPNDLWHFVTSDFRSANLWTQLSSGDNQDMVAIEHALAQYVSENPPPIALDVAWSGATHINLVWQGEMVRGMGLSLLGALGVVFLMMAGLFRSLRFGVLSMVPLTITMLVIYGIIGLVGKDYDMPIAVLSALTLGLSVDFAIHFLQRARSLYAEHGTWSATRTALFEEPSRAIARNAIVIAVGFTPLLFAPLVPYNTVGILMALIMAVSAGITLVALPAICGLGERRLFLAASAPVGEPTQRAD